LHLYTLDDNEAAQYGYYNEWAGDFSLRAGNFAWAYDEVVYPAGTSPFYRCALPTTGHLYTTDAACEGVAGAVKEGALGAIGAFDEAAWACTLPDSVPLIRFANTENGDHFYSANDADWAPFIEYRDPVRNTGPWVWEGVVGCVWP
jgi:hypothetical protein